MMQSDMLAETANQPRNKAIYSMVWRWHFYAGLYVIPFMVMLAVTGLLMLWIAFFQGIAGEKISVAPGTEVLAISKLQVAAEAAIPAGVAQQYLSPPAADHVAVFKIGTADGSHAVAINPYTAEIIEILPWRAGWYDFINDIHGSLLLGDVGDRLIEIAASLGILLVVTGLYMHWPRNGSGIRQMLLPSFSKAGRGLWKSLHGVTAFWFSLVLVFFLISGLSWTGIWGSKFVQAWNSFPAEKWDNVPLSDATHASMNHGSAKEVPWNLEQTPLPQSGSLAGSTAITGGIAIDSVDNFAAQLGFGGRYQINLPADTQGVWTISHDSMSNDGPDPAGDRTIHIDQFTGNVLADVRYADYSPYAKAMAWGIALHEGDLGLWNFLLNTIFILALIFISISGVVLWWKRRPVGAGRLVAPAVPEALPVWKGALFFALAIAMAFPMAGLAIVSMLLLDMVVISQIPALKRAFS